MIQFDFNKLSVEIVRLKSVTTALGGSITVVDEDKTEVKDVYKRIAVPLAVSRAFIVACGRITQYLKPVYVAVIRYGDHVISLERHPLSGLGQLMEELSDGTTRRWIPASESNIATVIKSAAEDGNDWFFDGRFMYRFSTNDMQLNVDGGVRLSADGRFRKVMVQSIDCQNLTSVIHLKQADRSCFAYVASSGKYAVSPPIWKNLSAVGMTHMSMQREDEDDGDDGITIRTDDSKFVFDQIDSELNVNLNFALKASKEIGELFGFESVEPLQLPQLMIDLHTVNLPNVSKSIKHTYAIGMKFTHALAWLVGLSRRANTLDTLITMRSLMKYLTQRGIFNADSLRAESVFKEGFNVESIERIDPATINIGMSDFDKFLIASRADRKTANPVSEVVRNDF